MGGWTNGRRPDLRTDGFVHPNAPAGGTGPGFSCAVAPAVGRNATPSELWAERIQVTVFGMTCEATQPTIMRRIGAVRAALDESKGYVPELLVRRTGIALHELAQGFIPGLLAVVGVLAASTGVGAGIGALAGGVGAAPGAATGFSFGLLLLEIAGIGFLAAYIADGVRKISGDLNDATRIAWYAIDQQASTRSEVRRAAFVYAGAFAEFGFIVLEGIVTALLAAGAARAAMRVGELAAKFRGSRFGAPFAAWLEANWRRLVDNPKLRRRVAEKFGDGGGSASGGRAVPPGTAKPNPLPSGKPASPGKAAPPAQQTRPAASPRTASEDAAAAEAALARTRAQRIAEQGDFSTPKDRSVFYSGPGNRDRALATVRQGGRPIDDTPGGKALNNEDLYGEFSPLRKEADRYWSIASRRFAEGAEGDVTAYIRGASPDRVFGQTELPILLTNPKVTSINGIPRQELAAMAPQDAFRAVQGASP